MLDEDPIVSSCADVLKMQLASKAVVRGRAQLHHNVLEYGRLNGLAILASDVMFLLLILCRIQF